MPREIALLDALVPTLFLAFIASVLVQVLLDRLFGVWGLYRHVWHPPLFRLSIFVCIFAVSGTLCLR